MDHSAPKIAELLARAVQRRHAFGLPSTDTDSFRLVHGEGDGLPGLTVDVYHRHLVASVYTETFAARERAWVDALAELGYEGIYLKRRPRQANLLADEERKARAPERVLWGHDAAPAILVQEACVPFEVRLGDGFSTGLFLDQRDNRARLAALAHDKSVLNLFAYTCAFGAVAARSGARRTVNLDVAKSALERGRRNYTLSGVALEPHVFLARDVREALPKLAKRGERFELVVLDPPSYARTERGPLRVERDYPELVTLSLRLLTEGGLLLACTNHQKLTERDLSHAITAGAKAASRRIRELEFVPPPVDHPSAPGRTPSLKSAWIRI